jgi:hypothetical protein
MTDHRDTATSRLQMPACYTVGGCDDGNSPSDQRQHHRVRETKTDRYGLCNDPNLTINKSLVVA